MKIKTQKVLNPISRVLAVLVVLCIIPSCAFALKNNPVIYPEGNATSENFTSVQSNMLDSISKQITDLQNLYTNISEATNTTELQMVLSSNKLENECMGFGQMNMGFGQMNMGLDQMNMRFGQTNNGFNHINMESECVNIGSGQINKFNPDMVKDKSDDNFAAVQPEVNDSLRKGTDIVQVINGPAPNCPVPNCPALNGSTNMPPVSNANINIDNTI
jgi:hypothetical protein